MARTIDAESDLIERSEVLKQLCLNQKDVVYIDKKECARRIEAIPSADVPTTMTGVIDAIHEAEYRGYMKAVEDRPKGEWIVYEGGWKGLDYYPPKCKCNQCGYEEELYILNAKPTNFCPNCGSDNRERNDDE